MMFISKTPGRWLRAALAIVGVAGCAGRVPDADQPWNIDPATLKPAGGTITLNGAPLSRAVVAFFARSGVPSVGETGDDGRYTLQTMNMDGLPPGDYKVTISYFLSPTGQPQGLAQRSAMVHSAAMLSARESLPPEYADLDRSKLHAAVGSRGGVFNFDIRATPKPPEEQDPDPSRSEGKGRAGPEDSPDQPGSPKAGAKPDGTPESP